MMCGGGLKCETGAQNTSLSALQGQKQSGCMLIGGGHDVKLSERERGRSTSMAPGTRVNNRLGCVR